MDWISVLVLYLGFIGTGISIENDSKMQAWTSEQNLTSPFKKPNESQPSVQGSTEYYTNSSTAITETECGTFQGEVVNTYKGKAEVYRGLYYGKSPTGDLRFKYPVPYDGYKAGTTYRVTEFCLPCKQQRANAESRQDPQLMSSEHCLCLNIYKPATCNKKNPKPVLIYYPETNFLIGSTSQPELDGSILAVSEEIVVVVVAYRLGAFGFLTGGGKDIPGNAAFWDAVLAATWVKKYIDSFGGDTGKITISGHGAGAVLVLMFLETPFCGDLFHRAMIFSPFGIANRLDSGQIAYQKSKSLSTLVGCAQFGDNPYAFNEAEIQCLKQISADLLAEQSQNILVMDNPFCSRNQLLPNQGINAVYYGSEYQLYQGKFLKNKPVLFGSVPLEVEETLIGATATTKTTGAILLTQLIGTRLRTRDSTNLKKAIEFYLDSIDETSSRYAFLVGKRTTLALNDYCIHCPLYEIIISLARLNKVFIYYYTYVASPDRTSPERIYGAARLDDQKMAFGMPYAMPGQYNENDRDVSCVVMDIWSDFVYGRKMKWPASKVGKQSALYVAIIKGDESKNFFELGSYYEKICPRLDA